MATTRGLERLVFFTDAIAAIAITLLILPLVDVVPELASEGGGPGALLTDHTGDLFGFVLSFAIIARLWFGHHQLFEHVAAYNRTLVFLTVLWAFTIALLPLPTALTARFAPEPGIVAFYIATMTVSSGVLTVISFLVARSPALQDASNPITARSLAGSLSTTLSFVLALVLGTAIPVVNYWALFLLFLAGAPLHRLLTPRLRRFTSEA